MPQSFSSQVLHVIFSTKNREPLIVSEVKMKLHAYAASVIRNNGCVCYSVGGVADHVHIAMGLSRTTSLADVIKVVKTSTNKWMKMQGEEFKGFSWQRGYAALSISLPNLNKLLKYIDEQEEHHRNVSFKEEYLQFLRKYEMEYDERYVWD